MSANIVTQEIQDSVSSLYIAFFGRAPDARGFGYWAEEQAAGVSPFDIAANFARSSEWISNYGGLTPTQQVTLFYNNVFNRDPDTAGLNYWVNEIENGLPVSTVAYQIIWAAYKGGANVDPADNQIVLNKIAVAEYFAIDLKSNDTTIAATAFDGVTQDEATVQAAEDRLSAAVNPAESFTLTTNIDVFTGGDSAVFYGQANTINPGDNLTAGANSVANLYIDNAKTYSLNATGVETLNIQDSSGSGATFNLNNVSGALLINNTESLGELRLTNASVSQTFGVDQTNADTDVTFKAGQGSAKTLNLTVDTAGISTDVANIRFHAAASNTTDKISSLNIEAAAGNSRIGLANYSATSSSDATSVLDSNNLFSTLTEVTLTGSGNVRFGNAAAVSGSSGVGTAASVLDSVTSVDGADNTGGFYADIATNQKNVTVIGGSGNDTVRFGGGYFNTNDSVDLGGGTNTLLLGDQLNLTSTDDLAKAINASKNVSILATDKNQTAANGGVDISSVAFSLTTFAQASTSTIGSGAAAASGAGASGGTAGNDALAFVFDSGDTLRIASGRIEGQDGGRGGISGAGGAGGDGGDAIFLDAYVDTGSTAISLVFTGTSSQIFVAGDGGGASGATAVPASGASGFALDATEVENISISTASANNDLTFTPGTGGASGNTSGAVKVGANATITLTGAGDVDFSRYSVESLTNANNLTVNASNMTGNLQVVTGSGNDVITGGSGNDVISGRTGVNTLTGGSGRDSFQFVEGNSTASSLTTITDFVAGTGGDVLNVYGSGSDFVTGTTPVAYALQVLTASELQTIANASTLELAVTAALGVIGDDKVAGFTYSGQTYVLFEDAGANNDTLVALTGVQVSDLTSANLAVISPFVS